jgi:hypothetical protein
LLNTEPSMPLDAGVRVHTGIERYEMSKVV